MSDTIDVTFVDPETGDEDEMTLKRSINGWVYDADHSGGAAVWTHPDRDDVYVGWEKTGGYSWSAWVSVPGEIPRNTVYNSFGDPDKALDEAERLMQSYDPNEAATKDW